MTRKLLVIFIALILAGCATMAPKYVRPAPPVPGAWPVGPAYKKAAGKPAKAVADIPWKKFFLARNLRNIISLALKNNRDLRLAALNIERSRAQYRIQRSNLFPKIDAFADGNLQGVPRGLSITGHNETAQEYDVGLGLSSYELDLFGRIRSLKNQALNQYFATEQARRSVQISLVAQVASSYLDLAADQERYRLAEETLANQQAYYLLVKSRFEDGIASALDVQQSKTSVEAARFDIAYYMTVAAQDENALNLLAGTPVTTNLLPEKLSGRLAYVKDITPGLPSEALLSRPDILQAEDLLKAANANIGAARAAFFPRITLVSSVGLGSDDLVGLFKPGSFAWKFAPQITVPIFNAGSNRANLKVSETDKKIAVATYEKAIQTAFREVADALAERGTIDEQVAAQQALTNADALSYRLAKARYEEGVDSYLNVLDSQRSLYAARQNLISARLARLMNLVALYKVLGGGAI